MADGLGYGGEQPEAAAEMLEPLLQPFVTKLGGAVGLGGAAGVEGFSLASLDGGAHVAAAAGSSPDPSATLWRCHGPSGRYDMTLWR